ncbi:MAG: hypothetical protein D6718_00355 [Acidobacteria bacterium]|nr:MAG: hypothetical protein D6718_00355 [Acidobacteriota bacterium]
MCRGSCSAYDTVSRLLAFEGFATLFEIMQTYTPSPPAFGFTVPYMPEGLERADSFDTYYGSLTKPLDLSRAQPLQCAYGAGSNVGDRLTFPDTAPDPAPGEAVYFLTAVTFGTERRIGRSATGGRLAGRDPSALPRCPVPSVEP